ncbi:MAG: hypothetical protein QOG42_1052 [Solirubrobacteraceae bacterium]|nr:hypothetical protein [Solirubrobacteraceae bacterium]
MASATEALSDAVLAIAAEHAVEPVLQKLVDAARELAGARYAAIGVPDGDGGFGRFITSGMSAELIESLGELPRQHGLLGAILESAEPYRTADVRDDPRFRGWWPATHPSMSSFLGVPIVSGRGDIAGAFYLTDKEGAAEFAAEDEDLIAMLAAHAAVAIENARLYERSRELSAIEERNRHARDLHDSVAQKLFGIVLAAQSAATLLDRSAEAARPQVERLVDLAQETTVELRSLVFQLRPAAIESDGLASALTKHVEVLRRVHRLHIDLDAPGPPRLRPGIDEEVFKIAQEALQNALRHSGAGRLEVSLRERDGELALRVADDGAGFDPSAPARRSRSLGLTSMEERAAALGATLRIDSAPGAGTTISLEVPV